MSRQRFKEPYMWSVIAIGALVILLSAYRLPIARLDPPFLLLALIMIVISSSIAIRIPRISGGITVSDTFIFLTMLLYGGEAAILLAALEAAFASLRVSRKSITILFNSAMLACSTFLTVWVLRLFFGPITDLPRDGYSANFFIALCVMALVQYVANSGLIAVEKSCKIDQPVWHTWNKYYLWTSITYLAGASAAGIIAKLIGAVGFYAFFATLPIIAIVYFTYRTYLKSIEVAAAQAEQAQRHVEELNHYIAEAEAANRIKDEFLATLSHELRTPLTSILGWAGLLRTWGLSEQIRDQALESIERNARVQSQLIDDLLDVSRIISGKLRLDTKPVDLGPVIEAAIDVVRPAAEAKNIQIRYMRESAVGPVLADAGRLQQVVWNLLSNAVKFTPDGGRVEVQLERVNSYARITVSDTGRGISAKFLPYVFERFRQADSTSAREHGGLGLGLAIARHLVELHGGTVHVESEGEGRGATFSVSLPIMAIQMETKEVGQASQPVDSQVSLRYQHTLTGLRVLVVDDAADARRMISAVLTHWGAEVRTSASAREALEVLEEWKPDVLVSDIGMPGEDGYDLIQRVRALAADRGGRIPAAALTAYAREEDRKRVLAAGYQMHVAKPVGPAELISTVADLAGRVA
jgi:signal transduction histidine kinase